MSDRVLDLQFEPNLLLNADSTADFWEQYFELQKLATAVDLADGRFSVQLVNKKTGEKLEFSSIRLSSNAHADAN